MKQWAYRHVLEKDWFKHLHMFTSISKEVIDTFFMNQEPIRSESFESEKKSILAGCAKDAELAWYALSKKEWAAWMTRAELDVLLEKHSDLKKWLVETLIGTREPTQSEWFVDNKKVVLTYCEKDADLAQYVLSQRNWTIWITQEELHGLLEKHDVLKRWLADNLCTAQESTSFVYKKEVLFAWCEKDVVLAFYALSHTEWATWMTREALDGLLEKHDDLKRCLVETLLKAQEPTQLKSFARNKEVVLDYCGKDAAIARCILSHRDWAMIWMTRETLDGLIEKHDLKRGLVDTLGTAKESIQPASFEYKKAVLFAWCEKDADLARYALSHTEWAIWMTREALDGLIEKHDLKKWLIGRWLAEKSPTETKWFKDKKEVLFAWCTKDVAIAFHVLCQREWGIWLAQAEVDDLLAKHNNLKKRLIDILLIAQEPTESESFIPNKEALASSYVFSQNGWTISLNLAELESPVEKNDDLAQKEKVDIEGDSALDNKYEGVSVVDISFSNESHQLSEKNDDLEKWIGAQQGKIDVEGKATSDDESHESRVVVPLSNEESEERSAIEIPFSEQASVVSLSVDTAEQSDLNRVQAELVAFFSPVELADLFIPHDDLKEWVNIHRDALFEEKINDEAISENEKKIVLLLCKKNEQLARRFLEENEWSLWFTHFELLSLIEAHTSLHAWFDKHQNEIIPIEKLGGLTSHELYVCAHASEVLAEHIVLSDHFDKLTQKHRDLLSQKYDRIKHLIEVMTTPTGAIKFITPFNGGLVDQEDCDALLLSAYHALETVRPTTVPFYRRLVYQVAQSTELKWVPESAFSRLLKLHPVCLVELFHYPQLLRHLSLNELKILFGRAEKEDGPYFQQLYARLVAAYHQNASKQVYQLKDIAIPQPIATTDLSTNQTTFSDKFATSFLGGEKGLDAEQWENEKYLALEVLSSKVLQLQLYPERFQERCASYLSIPSRAEYQHLDPEQKQKIVAKNHDIEAAYYAHRETICSVKDIVDAIRKCDPIICMRIAELIQDPAYSVAFLPAEYHPYLNEPMYWYALALKGGATQAYLPFARLCQQRAETEENLKNQKQWWRKASLFCMKAFDLSPEIVQKKQAGLMLAQLYEGNKIEFSESEILEYAHQAGATSLTSEEMNEIYASEWHERLLAYGCLESVMYFLQHWQERELLQLCQRTLQMDFNFSQDQHFELYSALMCLLDVIYKKIESSAFNTENNQAAFKAQIRVLYDACIEHSRQGGVENSLEDSGVGSNIKNWLEIQNHQKPASRSKMPKPPEEDNAQTLEIRCHYLKMYEQLMSIEHHPQKENKAKMHEELFSTKHVTKDLKRIKTFKQ